MSAKIKRITSETNAQLKVLRSLLQSKGIRKAGQFLISGEKVVLETLKEQPDLCAELLVPLPGSPEESATPVEDLLPENLKRPTLELMKSRPSFSLVGVAPKLFSELDVFGTHKPLLVAQTPSLPEWNENQEPEGLEVLCALSDPSNLGALIRTCDAFGVTKLVLLKESASPFHPRAVRAASGSTFRLKMATGPSIKDLSKSLYALDMNGEDIATLIWPKNARLLLGEEGQGTPTSKDFRYIKIPMREGIESLNATVAASLAIYSYTQSK